MKKSEFRKNVIILAIAGLILALTLEAVSSRYSLYITRDDHMCLPYKYLYVKKGIIPKNYEDLISFKSIGIPNFEDGITFVKLIAGLPGDVIKTEIFPENEKDNYQRQYDKNGELITLRLQGRIYLYRNGRQPMIFDVLDKDSLGKKLPMIKASVIPIGKYFVIGTDDRTFDSRYWGLLDEKQVIGQAYPIPFGIGQETQKNT